MTAESKGNARPKTSQLNLSQSSPPEESPRNRGWQLHHAKTFPAIVPDGIYTRAQVEANLGISSQTLTFWIQFNGLQSIQPGTRAHYFIGSEVIAFMASHRSGISKPKSAKEKIERRKGGAK